jgi:hypothetical protein
MGGDRHWTVSDAILAVVGIARMMWINTCIRMILM